MTKREIKFRAWNGVLHEYRTIDMNSGKQNLGMGFESTEGIGSNTTTIYHSFGDVIEQFTGLTDVNSKEIYESDILRVTTGEDGESYIATVKWFGDEDYPAFDLEGIPATWNYDANALATIFNSGIETYEVIGNVHTNPELLEADE